MLDGTVSSSIYDRGCTGESRVGNTGRRRDGEGKEDRGNGFRSSSYRESINIQPTKGGVAPL